MHIQRLFAFLLGLVVVSAISHAADWPQWRGPNRDGISSETGLLKQWPEGGPMLAWQVTDAGDGFSTPSVVGDRIYLLGNQGLDDEFLQARNVNDGAVIWSTRLGKVGPNQGPQYPGARSTPTVDGKLIYALGSDGDLVCLDTAGSIPWQKNLRSDFGGKPGQWAYAESPLIDGDLMICTPGGKEATMVALNKQSGDVVWKSEVPGGDDAAFSSIVSVEGAGVKQYVQFLQKGLVGIDAKSGTFLWRYEQSSKGSPANIPTPLAHEGFVYSATGRGGGGLVKLKPAANGIDVEEIYSSQKLPKAIGGAVLVDNFLYGTGDAMMCVDFATGDEKWTERGIGAASICYADGRLYLHGENGDVALVAASTDSYHEHGRFTPKDAPNRGNAKAWAYPVVANGRLYIRDKNALWSYDLAK